jgi:uncharacterized protein (TIGR04255 family)
MPTPATNQGQFQPVHAAHSIEQAVFVMHFDRPLNPQQLGTVISVTNQFKSELPGGGPIQGMAFSFGGPAIQVPVMPQSMSVAGVLLNRTAPDGSLESELRLEQASMSFRTTRYSRWTTIWNSAQRYFEAVLGVYLDTGAQLVSVGLNFVDKFVWHGDINDCDASKLLRNNSEYVAPHVFNRRDLWHIHSGAFESVDRNTKRLINMNIDCLDETIGIQPRRVIMITTVLTDIFGQPGFDPISLTRNSGLAFISEHMASLHAFDKEILGNTIVESMAQQIALNG